MTVLSYLTKRAAQAVLSSDESDTIKTSILTLSKRLDSYFQTTGDGLSKHFRFGSSTRGTILPRSMDAHSDIDYMIVFEKSGFTPQTYLDRFKRFVEQKYATSELYQSNPTIVLELNHIKFDLVPALAGFGSTYNIPDGSQSWRSTNPNDFNSSLEQANKNSSFLLKPAIRLAKVWNAENGYVLDSYSFEKWIKDRTFLFATDLTDFVFSIFSGLSENYEAQWRNDKIKRAKEIVSNVRTYEKQNLPSTAEAEVKKLIKE
ncbi:MAG: nucleotidyltransferase [Tardiphaga sp.]|uniref:SMODS domain-containing nucleotidyltransferase n=1 Tax=Tardiphaga sp. TaxID=1926292 RepID=UPI002605E5CB|nr:nucleotidyltransferase [Tardiphaga sp.]MDB5501872.1 nucleotidyltransferase [Tardiphaga sp.]